MTDRYAVIGNPISHSKSPLIHHAFAEQLDQDLLYTAELIPLDGLNQGLKALQTQGFKGINVTVPFKEQVWQILENKSEQATLAGAVNTVLFNDDGSSYGDNTDGTGLCRDLVNNHALQLADSRILLLGAGGAARGVILPLLKYKPAELVIANRTVSKAQTLASLFSKFGNTNASSFEDISGQFDLIINATSASLQGDVPPIPTTALMPTTCCYDMMYAASDTAFIQWAKANNITQTFDGLGMLVEQAAEAFYLWRGVRPNTQTVIATLRQ
jgi:shikimate dehydrogenase